MIYTAVPPTRDNEHMADLIQSLPMIMLVVLAVFCLMMVVFGTLLASVAARMGDDWRAFGGAYVAIVGMIGFGAAQVVDELAKVANDIVAAIGRFVESTNISGVVLGFGFAVLIILAFCAAGFIVGILARGLAWLITVIAGGAAAPEHSRPRH